ncbi:MAG: hypothetical protein Ta2F_07200 [Termitinemataceae bacterium]|nr:MAG: hypothetical protein Ta2F_07200 [Termitinemataceae bacterium]
MKLCGFFIILFSGFFTLINLNAQEQKETVKLSWQDVEYASQYEIIVEKTQSDGGYITVVDEIKHDVTQIECLLTPGFYRYQVIVYDLFERGTVKSDWFPFEVKQKTAPKEAIEETEETIEEVIVKEKEEVAVEPEQVRKKTYDWSASFAYSPIFSLIKIPERGTTSRDFLPLSFTFGLSIIPFKTKAGNIGFEFLPSVSLLRANFEESTINSMVFGFALNVLYQVLLNHSENKALFFDVRLGGGTSLFYNFHFKKKEDTEDQGKSISELTDAFAPLIRGSLSIQKYFNRTLYIDAGAQYQVLFFANSIFHFISPFMSVGGKF